MEKHLLSKSTFIRGTQCLKSLYLYKYHINWRDKLSDEQRAIFERGNSVGLLARQLFGSGKDASPKRYKDYEEAVYNTQKFIEEGTEVIYEAAFQFERVLVLLDILVKKNGLWYGYEVKSSSKITATYLLDAALQYYVITNAGLPLADISIVTVNTEYIKEDRFEIQRFFNIKSVQTEVLKKQEEIKIQVDRQKQVIASGTVPQIEIGEHCYNPYQCDFMGHCWKHIPDHSIFDIAGMHKKEMFELYGKGIVRMEDIPGEVTLPARQQVQVNSVRNNSRVIDAEGIKSFLGMLSYPIYFIDFESFMPAVPIYKHSRPYQAIPFQYSIHLKENKESELKHFEFLAEAGKDPRSSFISNFLKDTAPPGDILAYNASFEKGILNALKNDFPQHAADLDERISRVKDLMHPFEKKFFYTKEMKGSHSIKAVLPAMVKGFSYEQLTISNGAVAMNAFEKLQTDMDIFSITETREALLAYCKMDTFAMVKIFEELEKI